MGKYEYKYPRPLVTTDNVIFGFGESELKILLIKRGQEPFKNSWALPGGFMDIDEDAGTCALRELKEETGIEISNIEQFYTFTNVDRDPRDRVISIAFYALIKIMDYQVMAGDDATIAKWITLSELPVLAFDHAHIISKAIQHLRNKIKYQPIGLELLPEEFSITELQHLYELIIQKRLDLNQFEKKMLSTGLLLDATEKSGVVDHYSLKRYGFNKVKFKELSATGYCIEF